MAAPSLEEVYTRLVIYGQSNNVDQELTDIIKDIKRLVQAKEDQQTVKGWVKGKGFVVVYEGKKAEVQVYRNKEYPGVILHREYAGEKVISKTWVISHEITGLRLANKMFSNMSKAAKAFVTHAAGVDWNREAKEIVKDEQAKKAYAELNK